MSGSSCLLGLLRKVVLSIHHLLIPTFLTHDDVDKDEANHDSCDFVFMALLLIFVDVVVVIVVVIVVVKAVSVAVHGM
jgi:hypothetical protein